MEKRKRPELVELPEKPTVLKISEVPSGVCLMKLNPPYTLDRFARAGVKKCWVFASTNKSVNQLLGKEVAELKELKNKVTQMVRDKYPYIAKRIWVGVSAHVSFGHRSAYKKGKGGTTSEVYHYVSDLPRMVQELNEIGLGKIPIKHIMFPMDYPPFSLVTFTKVKDITGLVASQIGKKMYDELSKEQIIKLIQDNPILQKLKTYVCETKLNTGTWLSCEVPK